jgi:outer membrane protein assembly factor BamD
MKKRIFSLLLAAVLSAGLLTPALAANAGEAEQAAWTLYHYGLFQGVSVDSRGFPDFALDQTPTRACLATITEYLLEYPTDGPHVEACAQMIADLRDRLDRKEFENARLYYKMEDYLAARVALRNVLKDNAENGYREDILYYTAMASYHYARMSVPAKQKERYLVFVDDYLNFIGENPESKYRRELDAMYRRSQRALGRYDGIDEELDLKAKDFERERKAIEKEKEGVKNN